MGSNPGSKVRIVGRIRALNKDGEFFDGVSASKPWISVSRPDHVSNPNLRPNRVKISFGSDQVSSTKQSCEVDECYEQDVDTKEIFSREIKPLISRLFEGQNNTVFAYGPRGSGKSYTIQGCEEELGLAALSVDAVLPLAEEQGKVVTVSVFEVYQDRVSDLLDPKRPEVAVFEDAQGKIRLKGLSKVKVNSTLEFQTLYLQAANVYKQIQKMTDPPRRNHVGCVVHVVSPQTENSNAQLVGKINFIDLASYEDSKRKSSDGSNLTETTRINKSLYAVHNVLYALNAKESRVPYRESKLTRMLQDSLGGMSRILMITCMNSSLCQETVQTVSLASRSCMAGFLACLDPGKSSRTVTKTIGLSSPQVMKSASKFNIRSNMMSPKIVKPMSTSASGKKQVGSKLNMSIKKAKELPIEARGRKLFDEANQSKKSEQKKICPKSASTMELSSQKEASPSLASNFSAQQEEQFALSTSDMDASQLASEEGKSSLNDSLDSITDSSQFPFEKDVLPDVKSIVPATHFTCQTPPTVNFLLEDKENRSYFPNDGSSPPLSARIRELSNNLKSLCFSTEANLKMAQNSSNLIDQVIHENLEPLNLIDQILPEELEPSNSTDLVIHENLEPETPKCLQKILVNESNVKAEERNELANIASPWESFHMRGSGVKDSLVQEYLKFLNSASKEELKGLKGIGEKRATYILELREESPEPFKQLDDLKDVGLSSKQIKKMMKDVAGELF